MSDELTPEEELLHRRIGVQDRRGRIITDRTAREIATRLVSAVGPGLRVFLTTGMVTPELYAELARTYDLRRPEVEGWLDALTRYCLRQPVVTPDDGQRPRRREGRG